MLELGRIEDLTIIRDNHIFGDAMTAVEIVLMTRTEDGFKKNVRASDEWLWDANGDGSDFVLTDDKTWLSSFCAGKATISQYGFTVRTGSIVWNQHKAEFSDAGGNSMLRCVFARDIATDGTLVMSDKNQRARTLLTTISGAHRLRTGNRCEQDGGQYRVPISEVRDDPSGRTFLRRVGGSENKTKELYDSLMAVKSEDLSRYLRAVTGNSQCSARELGRLPLVWRQPDIEPGL